MQSTLSVFAAFARFISKFAEPGRWCVTYGRLTATATYYTRIYMAQSGAEWAGKSPWYWYWAERPCSLSNTPTPTVLQILEKRMVLFLLGRNRQRLMGKSRERSFYHHIAERINEFEWKKVKIKDARQRLSMLSADSELCNEIANSPHMLRALNKCWIQQIMKVTLLRQDANFFIYKRGKIISKKSRTFWKSLSRAITFFTE